MKRKGPSFGHAQVEYRLDIVFKRAIKGFQETEAARVKIEKEYDAQYNPPRLLPQLVSTREREMESGVMLIMATGAWLEQVINDYAHTFLDADWYEEHLDNLRTLSKWTLLPYVCQKKEISEDDPAINALREFIKARNAIVHHKRRDWYLDLHKACKQTSSESARFWSACKNAGSMVNDLIELLTSPPPGATKK